MRSLATKGTFITFILHGTKFILKGQTFLVQCSILVGLSPKHMKLGYLGHPPC